MFQLLNPEIEEDKIEDWLECDGQDMGYAHLNDDEIVLRVTQEPMQQLSEDIEVEAEVQQFVTAQQ